MNTPQSDKKVIVYGRVYYDSTDEWFTESLKAKRKRKGLVRNV